MKIISLKIITGLIFLSFLPSPAMADKIEIYCDEYSDSVHDLRKKFEEIIKLLKGKEIKNASTSITTYFHNGKLRIDGCITIVIKE